MPNPPQPAPAPGQPAPTPAPGAAAAPTAAAGNPASSCDCGPLAPLPGEAPLALGTSADAIVSQIQLECDNETGVFFFRFKGRLYLRIVKIS